MIEVVFVETGGRQGAYGGRNTESPAGSGDRKETGHAGLPPHSEKMCREIKNKKNGRSAKALCKKPCLLPFFVQESSAIRETPT